MDEKKIRFLRTKRVFHEKVELLHKFLKSEIWPILYFHFFVSTERHTFENVISIFFLSFGQIIC
jgi:hypothetical protein